MGFIDFALKAHGTQQYGNKPYRVHLEAVAEVLRDFGYTSDKWQAAAWLHDTVEDCGVALPTISRLFGEETCELVWAVSGMGKNRKEKQANIISKLHMCKEACVLKLADRIANLEAAILEGNTSGKMDMYHKELPAFEKVVRKHVSEEMWARLANAFEYGKSRGWC